MGRLGDRFLGMNNGPVDCEVVFTGAMHFFDPLATDAPSLPSSLHEGETSCPAKPISMGMRTKQGATASGLSITPSGAPGGWS